MFLPPGCQRGLSLLPLLLAVVEDGRHVLPEVGCRQDDDGDDINDDDGSVSAENKNGNEKL